LGSSGAAQNYQSAALRQTNPRISEEAQKTQRGRHELHEICANLEKHEGRQTNLRQAKRWSKKIFQWQALATFALGHENLVSFNLQFSIHLSFLLRNLKRLAEYRPRAARLNDLR
jgi:hypothetical protein